MIQVTVAMVTGPMGMATIPTPCCAKHVRLRYSQGETVAKRTCSGCKR